VIAYFGTRLFRWLTGLLLVLFVSYVMMYYGAGDPVRRMFLDRNEGAQVIEEEVIQAIRDKYGLDDPFPQQFVRYLTNLLQGNFGWSFREKRPVLDMVLVRLPISMQLGIAATLLMTLIGIPLGVIAALKHNRWLDQLIVGLVVFLHAVPIFVTGPLLLLFFVLGLGIMDVPLGWKGIFHHQIILPLFVLVLGPLPVVVRQTRSAMLEVIGEDYIRTARAKGLTEKLIIIRHMVRPVLIPVITSIGLIMIGIVNGAIVVELIFNIPGFGNLTMVGLRNVDYPIIMSTVLVGALIVMISNLFVDFIYPFLDPRITKN
jgi:ABC-type dipeptide/oligopeptide/nickel transport system permease component